MAPCLLSIEDGVAAIFTQSLVSGSAHAFTFSETSHTYLIDALIEVLRNSTDKSQSRFIAI